MTEQYIHSATQPCECTKVVQDETCPVGYPSLLCETCGGTGMVPYVKLDGPELWEIVFGANSDAATEITDEQYDRIATAINSVFIEPILANPTIPSVEDSPAIKAVIAERRRQIRDEGWTPEHDDTHASGEMARAAAFYTLYAEEKPAGFGRIWPWTRNWCKPTGKRRNLVKAAALIIAEIERLDRRTAETARPEGGK